MKRFPDCDLFNMPQRSESWHDIRRDKLTGSAMGSWLAEVPECRMTIPEICEVLTNCAIPLKKSAKRDELLALMPEEFAVKSLTKTAADARERAICKILGSISRCEVPDEWDVDPDGPPPRNPALWAIWNGIRLEPEAVAHFERETGLTVEPIGFARHKSKATGCSPDGLIVGLNEGFEGKCPIPSTHMRYFRAGGLPDEYRDQVHGCMAVTGAAAWWFQSYCPGLPSLQIRVERDEYTERMSRGIWQFATDVDNARRWMAMAWSHNLA